MPKQTYLQLTIAGTDITKDITPDLLSFSYIDNETQEADTIDITVKDEDGKWAGNWKPDNGEIVKAVIMPGDTEGFGLSRLNCGSFYVDSLRATGAPRTCEIGAVSVPLDKPIRRKAKTKAWEKKDLKGIASEIAKEAGLTLLYDAKESPEYDRVNQKQESDLSFLQRLCENAALSLKVTSKQLVIFDQASYESKPPIKIIALGASEILSWEFSAAAADSYKSVTVTYRDPKKNGKEALVTYTYTDPLADANGQEYEHKVRARSLDDAKRLAKAKLRALNRRAVTGNLTLVGDVDLVAGVVLLMVNFGSFDGKFFITRAEHSVSNSGYTTSIEVSRVNSNY